MSSAQLVWEISRAVLADKDGVVAVLKMFMDESGIHDGSPVVTVGAYLARPKTWKDWTKEWNLKKRPIKVFHATDCAALRGEFKGWSEQDRNLFVAQLLPVLNNKNIPGVVIGINLNDFNQAMKSYPDLKEMFGTPYTACFQWVIRTVLKDIEESKSNERIAFFHEINQYKGEAMEAFEWIKRDRKNHNSLMTLSFGSKEDYTPLQAADVLAYEGNKKLRDVQKKEKRRSLVAMDPDEQLRILYYNRENMPKLIDKMKTIRDQAEFFESLSG